MRFSRCIASRASAPLAGLREGFRVAGGVERAATLIEQLVNRH